MKAILEFDLDDPSQEEEYRRVSVALKMAGILYDLVNNDYPTARVKISEESSKAIREYCYDEGIRFEDIYS